MAHDVLQPPIDDGSGYGIRRRDLRFLGLSDRCVSNWRTRAAPLGLTVAQFRVLRAEFCRALRRDGVDPATCDLRIKGSSVEFYSGPHKPMPKTSSDVIDAYRSERSEVPQGDLAAIMQRLQQEWITDQDFPARRPFDSFFKLGITREPSDIDVQLSGDLLVRRCTELFVAWRQEPTPERVFHARYDFVRKDLVEKKLDHTYTCALKLTVRFDRHVNVVIFPSKGPPVKQRPPSSHFRDSDWCVDTNSPASGR